MEALLHKLSRTEFVWKWWFYVCVGSLHLLIQSPTFCRFGNASRLAMVVTNAAFGL